MGVLAAVSELPALPLHEAGKYVAGAYVVLFVLVLIYVAIMAMRLSRIERELGELLRAPASRPGDPLPPGCATRELGADSGSPRTSQHDMSELLALGISHKTAPVALRERLAFTRGRARSRWPSG